MSNLKINLWATPECLNGKHSGFDSKSTCSFQLLIFNNYALSPVLNFSFATLCQFRLYLLSEFFHRCGHINNDCFCWFSFEASWRISLPGISLLILTCLVLKCLSPQVEPKQMRIISFIFNRLKEWYNYLIILYDNLPPTFYIYTTFISFSISSEKSVCGQESSCLYFNLFVFHPFIYLYYTHGLSFQLSIE